MGGRAWDLKAALEKIRNVDHSPDPSSFLFLHSFFGYAYY
jgi:hypothetical protein